MIFFRKKIPNLLIRTDFHSHLIPGIDDGAKDMTHSLQLIKELSNLGYRRLITTPHIKNGQYNNTIESIADGMDMLRSELVQNNIDMHIAASAEYYYDEAFLQAIIEDKLLHINRFVLFEFSYVVPPVNIEDMIYELKARNYTPVLAHPERYLYYHTKLDQYEYLKNLGIYFQININSLAGHYGKSTKKVAKYLSEKGFIDFVGSDVHNSKHINVLKDVISDTEYKKIFNNNKILNDDLTI
ncbi:Capsular polysaccharide biosynthesis protein [Sulfurovum sp. enrichment culture clone C5]|uniref:protein-tyrosine-phosphatase n=1 Tax=Sulfurovum sp. enrichment culture clone C5 TaxID=497650 RepID=A0A0S4XQQ6_9BACT|nr:Capsular polysaccharide biosynthesis protein [Sulfurovum sp. enrichment culture clone C5]